MPDNNKDEASSVQAFSKQMEELVEKHLVESVFEALLATGMPAEAIVWVVQNRINKTVDDLFAKHEEESRAFQAALDEVAVKNRVQLARLAETMMKPPMVTLRSKREAMLLAKIWGPDEPIKAENMKKELEREQNAAKKDVVANVERALSALEEDHGNEGL